MNVAAIDAGSNAIRLRVSRSLSAEQIEPFERRRYPIRLGHSVFAYGRLDGATMNSAVEAFREFAEVMTRHEVKLYRAVATSACREAANGAEFVARIREKAGLHLEVIDAAEEARLIHVAVADAVSGDASPSLSLDLGGGSLEVAYVSNGTTRQIVTLPIGTVRLIEQLKLADSISEEELGRIRRHVSEVAEKELQPLQGFQESGVVATGGNAEALATLAPGKPLGKTAVLDIYQLEELLWTLLRMSAAEREQRFKVRRDRAEVMAVAAVILTTLGRLLQVHEFLVPGVGVKEGITLELVQSHWGRIREDAEKAARGRLTAARRLALRCGCHPHHTESVRAVVLQLYDQLQDVHGMDPETRHLLELGAILHDVGHFVNRKKHALHGEYLVRNSPLSGVDDERRQILACLVRYHAKSEPKSAHDSFSRLNEKAQRQVRLLASLLRIAEALDIDHRQKVDGVRLQVGKKTAVFQIAGRYNSSQLSRLRKKGQLFRKEFGLNPVFELEKPAERADESQLAPVS